MSLTAGGAQQYPICNSQLTEDASEIIFKAHHNIGFAMDSPQGCVVGPGVLRRAVSEPDASSD